VPGCARLERMTLECPACAAHVPGSNVNIQALAAVCEQCDTVFQFQAQPYLRESTRPSKVPMPKEMTPDPDNARLYYRRPYGRIVGAFLVGCSSTIVVASYSLLMEATGGWWMVLMMTLFVAPFIYVGLASYINLWAVQCDDGFLSARYAPLRLLPTKTFQRSEVQQLYVHQRLQPNGLHPVYDVYAQLHGGRTGRLLKGLPNSGFATYIVQYVEDMLGVDHRAVPGEHVAAPHVAT
jgi:hypothetical protein